MRERPILFCAGMVRAVLDGRKTQTRRVIRPMPRVVNNEHGTSLMFYRWRDNELFTTGACFTDSDRLGSFCSLGQIGDRLWVRETWDVGFTSDAQFIRYKASADEISSPTELRSRIIENWDNYASKGWRPSIHMPRWASRITLEITNVRVERVQSITAACCGAEGVARDSSGERVAVVPGTGYLGKRWQRG